MNKKTALNLQPELELELAPKEKRLAGGCMKESDYLVRRYTAKIPVTHTLDDVETPEYFQFYADVLAKARGFGPVKLEVLSDDCSIHAEFLVLEATRAGVKLRRLHVHHDASALPEVTEDNADRKSEQFDKSWSGKNKWRITSHGAIVAVNIQIKETVDDLVKRLNAGTLSVDEIPSAYAAGQSS